MGNEKSGRRSEALRWTASMAGQEFGVDHHTVTKRLKQASIVPGTDGYYSTKQILSALYGDTDLELTKARIKDTTASAFLKDVKTDNLLRNNIPSGMVEKVWTDYIRDIVEKVKQSSMPIEERNSLLQDLGSIPLDKYFEDLTNEEQEENESEVE